MPRLPDIDSLGERPTPRALRPIVSYRGGIAEAALAEAHAETAALGQTIFGTGKAVAEFGQQQDKAAADAGLNEVATHSSKKAGEYAGHEDFTAAPDNYLVDVTQARDKLAEGIGGAAERQRFIDRSQFFIDGGLDRVRQGAWARQVDTGVKGLDTRIADAQAVALEMADAQTVALQTSDEAERSGIIYTVGADIQAAAERGYIARDTAKQRIDAWKQQFAEGWLDKLVPGDRRMVLEAAAEGSKGGIVSLIPEQRRAQLLPEVRRAADVHAQDSAAEARAAAAQAARDGLANRAAEHRAAFAAAIERRGDLSEAEKAAERARLDRILRANDLLGAYGRATNGDPEAGRAFIERARGDGAIADAGERAAAIRALEAEQGRLETRHAVAQVAAQDRRGREIVQSLLDGKLSRQDAYDEIGAIADPELRHYARRHLAGRLAAEDAARRQERSGALHAALDAVERGTPIGDLPGEVLGKLDPPAIAALRRAEVRIAKAGDGPPPASDAKALTRIEALIAEDPQAFARLDLAEARADLNRADYDRFARLRKLDMANPEAAYERATRNAYAGALRNAGRDPWSAEAEPARQNFADEVAAHEHIHGRKPDVGEARKIAEGVAGDGGAKRGSAGDDVILGEGGKDAFLEGKDTAPFGYGDRQESPTEKPETQVAQATKSSAPTAGAFVKENVTKDMSVDDVITKAREALQADGRTTDSQFEAFLTRLLVREQGYVKNPDPLQVTNRGVTQKTLNDLRVRPEWKYLPETVAGLNPQDYYDIYEKEYFVPSKAGLMMRIPELAKQVPTLADMMFDIHVQHGPEHAPEWLQQSLNDIVLQGDGFGSNESIRERVRAAMVEVAVDTGTEVRVGEIDEKLDKYLVSDKDGHLKIKVDKDMGLVTLAVAKLATATQVKGVNDLIVEKRKDHIRSLKKKNGEAGMLERAEKFRAISNAGTP